MNRSTFASTAAFVSALALLLSACTPATEKPRVELPQNFRLPENDIVKMFEPRVGRIAITSDDGNIIVMDQTGGDIVQITKDANRGAADDASDSVTVNSYSLPVFSPNGQQLALVELTARSTPVSSTVEINPDAVIIQRGENSGVVVDGPNGQVVQPAEPGMRVERQPSRVIIERGDGGGELVSSALYLASTDGKRPLREIFNSDDHSISYIDWAPDNSKLAFLATNVQDEQAELKMIDARDGSRSKTLFDGADVSWNWHPDGQSLVARIGTAADASRLNTYDIAGDKAERVEGASDLAFNAPQYSPDGGFMLLTEKAGGKNKLVLADRDGKKIKDLTEFEGDSISFAWSPRGAQVAYIVRSAGQPGSPLTVLDVNSGEKRVITTNPVVSFFWSPDGQRIAAFSLANRTDIPENFSGFTVVPDMDTTLMYLETLDPANGNSRPLFYFAPTNAFLRLAAEFDRYSRGINIWSPDSRKLVFTLMFGDQSGTRDYVIESEASGSLFPRVIGNGGLAFWSPK